MEKRAALINQRRPLLEATVSLYNMLMGRNPFSPVLLGILGITDETKDQWPLGRIRDVYTNEAADRIFVLHRNYGEGDEVNARTGSLPLP